MQSKTYLRNRAMLSAACGANYPGRKEENRLSLKFAAVFVRTQFHSVPKLPIKARIAPFTNKSNGDKSVSGFYGQSRPKLWTVEGMSISMLIDQRFHYSLIDHTMPYQERASRIIMNELERAEDSIQFQ